MKKRRLIHAFESVLLLVLLAACQSQDTLQSPDGSSDGEVPLYPDAQRITVSKADSDSFIEEILGISTETNPYISSTNIAWTEDTGAKVQEQLDKLLPDSNWRLESEWSELGQTYVSGWRKGDLNVVLAYLDNLDSEQINDFNRRHGISVPEAGTTLIVTYLWDTTKPLPTTTPTETPIPSSTPIPSPTLPPLPTNTPRPTNTPEPTQTPVDFSEEFDGPDLDESVWVQVGPPIEIADGAIKLKSNLATFPYVYAKQNLFPSEGNFDVEISFRYSNPADRGTGLFIDKLNPQPGTSIPVDAVAAAFLSFWQGADNYPLTINFGGNRAFASAEPDLQQHTLELRYSGQYDVLLDGNLLYTSPPTEDRPSTIWFGNPSEQRSARDWSSIEIDYIRIQSTP